MKKQLTTLISRLSNFIERRDDSQFNDLALALFQFQFQHNAAYSRFCSHLRVNPAEITDWANIPAVPTSAFKALDLSVLPPEARTRVFHSSGTTEQRSSLHIHNSATLGLYEQSLLAWFRPHFVPDGPSIHFLFLTPPPEDAPHSSLVHMFGTIARHYASEFAGVVSNGAWQIDFEKTRERLSILTTENTPVAVCGTAFLFVHLCDWLVEHNLAFTLPCGSRVLETGGYKGRSRAVEKPELHAMIAAALGIPGSHIISEYGMSEISSQAYDRVFGQSSERLFHFPPWARALVISPETHKPVQDGETGLLRIYDLANVASVLAIQTEDLAIRRGDGFELLGRATQAERRGCSLMSND
jgi:hypothetical protein